MRLDPPVREQLLRQAPEFLSKLKVLGLRRELPLLCVAVREGLPGDRVPKRELDFDVFSIVLDGQEIGDHASLRADGRGRNLGALLSGDAIQCVLERVVRVVSDLLGALRIVVIQCNVCAKRFHQVEVARGACCDDLGAAGKPSILDGKRAGCAAPSVDQDGEIRLHIGSWERKAQRLIEPLADRRDSNAQCSGVLEGHVIGNLDACQP